MVNFLQHFDFASFFSWAFVGAAAVAIRGAMETADRNIRNDYMRSRLVKIQERMQQRQANIHASII